MNDAVTETKEEVDEVEKPAETTETQVEETPSREELLQEFDAGMAPNEQENSTLDTYSGQDARIEETFQFMQQERARRAQEDISNAVHKMKSFDESLSIYDDDMLEGWLDKQARRDSRLTNAWNHRHEQPEKWDKILATFAGELAKKSSVKQEKSISDDMESIRSDIKTSETKSDGPSPDEIVKMSDADFEDYVTNELGFGSNDAW